MNPIRTKRPEFMERRGIAVHHFAKNIQRNLEREEKKETHKKGMAPCWGRLGGRAPMLRHKEGGVRDM